MENIVEVQFQQHYQMFNVGEIASFTREEAKKLVDKGFATYA